MKKYKWIVSFEVAACWVADGFDLTDERALDMISHDLSYANVGTELDAKVLEAPDPQEIKNEQGAGIKPHTELYCSVREAIDRYDESEDHARHEDGADCVRCKLEAILEASGWQP